MSQRGWPWPPAGISAGPPPSKTWRANSGGASRQTWRFDAVVDGARHALILRRDPPLAGQPDGERSASLDRATEFRVLRAAHRAGVRAPEPLFELTPADGLGEAYVMRRVGGTAIARKLLRDAPYAEARRRIAGQLGEILARIHATDRASLPPLAGRQAADQIAGLRRALDLHRPSRSRCSSWRSPGSTAASPRRSPSRCWCMATTAPATISPTRRASPPSSTGKARISAIRSRTSAGCA